MLRAENLVKRYGEIRAVDGISFEVKKGELYGLLGPNGAGKTTTMSMLAGLLRPDEGRIFFDGVELSADPIRIKSELGVVPQETALYETLTATENLKFWAGMYDLSGAALAKAVDRALDQVGLSGRSKEPVKGFSGGMKRRLNLALGLVHGPRAVLMDEPTVGIDPQARVNILDAVRSVAASGTTILYTTHYLEEAETLCQRVAIMDHGRILAEGTVPELKRRVSDREVLTVSGAFEADRGREVLGALAGAQVLAAEAGKVILSVQGTGKAAIDALSGVLSSGLDLEGVEIRPPSLNSVFLDLTGRELRD